MNTKQRAAAREFTMGYVLAVSYFMIPLFLGGLISLAFFLWFVVAYIGICALVAAVVLGIPFGLLAWTATTHAGKPVRVLAFAIAGAATAAVACGIVAEWTCGVFQPLDAFGPQAGAGVLVLITFTAVCSALGWLTASHHVHPQPYVDALHGHTIEELAELLDK